MKHWDRFILISVAIGSVLLFGVNAHAQSLQNRTKIINQTHVIIADKPLPDKVYAFEGCILITVRFYFDDGGKIATVMGNGWVAAPGIVVTARHVFYDIMAEIESAKQQGYFPSGMGYYYKITGTLINAGANTTDFPLEIVAYGDPQTELDVMILETDAATKAEASRSLSTKNLYDVLSRPIAFGTKDPSLGEDLFVCGFLVIYGKPRYYVFNDFLIGNLPVNGSGLTYLYCLRGSVEPGYSGGPVLNKDGELVGMTIARTTGGNFVLTIVSLNDIKKFLKDNKIL